MADHDEFVVLNGVGVGLVDLLSLVGPDVSLSQLSIRETERDLGSPVIKNRERGYLVDGSVESLPLELLVQVDVLPFEVGLRSEVDDCVSELDSSSLSLLPISSRSIGLLVENLRYSGDHDHFSGEPVDSLGAEVLIELLASIDLPRSEELVRDYGRADDLGGYKRQGGKGIYLEGNGQEKEEKKRVAAHLRVNEGRSYKKAAALGTGYLSPVQRIKSSLQDGSNTHFHQIGRRKEKGGPKSESGGLDSQGRAQITEMSNRGSSFFYK